MDARRARDAVSKNRAGSAADNSPPSEAWLFAQTILGNSVPDSARAENEARAAQARREWADAVAPDRDRSNDPPADIAAASKPSEAWLFAQDILGKPVIDRQELLQFVADITGVSEGGWDPSKHPKGAFPQNRGWWSPTGGSGAAGNIEPDEGKSSGSPAASPQAPATKAQLPADHRGSWIEGSKGNGVFRYNDSLENSKAGLAGKEVRFENQNIAVGGLPSEAYFGGSVETATVEIATVTGFDADNMAADEAMRKKLSNPKWQRPEGYLWNHAGSPGSKKLELVNRAVHEAVSHKGPAAEPRAARRAVARGITGRAMGALTVYLTARDALQAAGVLQPDYNVAEREIYRYVADDGSVFVVRPSGLFSRAKREFVAGPRKEQVEIISDEQVEEYRTQAEKEWGKYIPGTLFRAPRFIPGIKRKSIPLIRYRFGVPYEAGWIDEEGVHHYSNPGPLIA